MSLQERVVVLSVVLWSATVCLVAAVGSPRYGELPFQISCEVDHTEIVYPRVISGKGYPSHASKLGSEPLPRTLRVALTWRGRKRLLTLFQNDVAAGKLVMTYDDEDGHNNDTVAETGGERCYYEGFLRKERMSYAAVSACDGLAGYIQTDEEMVFIEAASPGPRGPGVRGSGVSKRPHVAYTCRQSLPLSGNFTDTGEPVRVPGADPRPRRRRRRDVRKKRYLEVKMVVDHTVVNMHGKDRIKDYVLTLMNIANSVYQHHTLGVNLRVVVTEIMLLKPEEQKQVVVKQNAYRTVYQFCNWMSYRQSYARNVRHDIAVLLTREKMGPAGYAPITGLCNPSRSCAAITDEGFTSGFIIAHEMAHVFGLFHDGHGNRCTGRNYMSTIMAPLVEAKLNHFWWSDCSKERMQYVINYLYCLNDEPDMATDVTHYELDSGPDLPSDMGKHWSLDFQCRMEFGDQFGLCASFPSDQCHMLWCADRSSPHYCRTKRGPPAPGTNCGRERECRNYRCSYVGREKPVHGNWSAWSQWDPCSADCGVGITRRSRQCNNPRPAYGGKECEGDSQGWDTCAAKECDKTYYDEREAHCSIWDGMQIRRGQHDWKAYPAKKESDRCKQTCISSHTKEVVTIDVEISDGTPCDYDHPINICFQGKCLMVGCDGVQNSSVVYDSCGVCGGDNSQCKNVSGLFKREPASEEKYQSIVFLPKGVQNVKIVKMGNTKHFIALKDADFGTYPLNGDKKQGRSRVFVLAGALFEYKSKPGLESITTRGPVHANLEVMLYPNKDRRRASVMYDYSISKNDVTLEKRKYQWRFKEWSDCSVTCGEGVTAIVHVCHDKDTGDQVDDDKCQYLDPPRKDEAPCTRESCSRSRFMWALTNDWSECSAEGCGQEGVQTQGYECQLYFLDNDTYLHVDLHQCDPEMTPNETQSCANPPCKNLNWTIGDWSECSVTCGEGRQRRRVHCGDPDTDSDDILCRDIPPSLSRTCNETRCKDSPSGDQCQNKYSFCSLASGLSLKCHSPRFREICCRVCQQHQQDTASNPHLSQWDRYLLRLQHRRRRRRY